MNRKSIHRNDRCPCGSGKKHKHCCWKKGYEWVEDDEGVVSRSIPISQELADMLSGRLDELEADLQHTPAPHDFLFPKMQFEHVEHQLIEAMKAADIDPAIIYAAEKTGRVVSEENQHLISEKDLAEWHNAVAEYRNSSHN